MMSESLRENSILNFLLSEEKINKINKYKI